MFLDYYGDVGTVFSLRGGTLSLIACPCRKLDTPVRLAVSFQYNASNPQVDLYL